MNILFCLTNTFHPLNGGISKISLFLGNYFRSNNDRVFYLSIYKDTDIADPNQLYLSDENDYSGFMDIVINNKIDIVINQQGISPNVVWPISFANKLNVPVVTVYHNSLNGIFGFNSYSSRYGKLLDNVKLTSLANRLFHTLFRIKYGKDIKFQIENSAALVTLSPKFFNEVLWFGGCKSSSKLIAIPNARTIAEESFCSDHKIKELLFVGRLAPEKQPKLLVDIWNLIAHKYPDWKLTFVGSDILLEKTKDYVKRNNVPQVYFEGFQDPTQYYKRAPIFCMTSAYEGFGLVLVEAMTYGTVPIAFNSYPNADEIIDNNVNGFLVTPFDINEYASRISELIEKEGLREQLAKNAMEKSKVFSVETIGDKWYELFSSLLENK